MKVIDLDNEEFEGNEGFGNLIEQLASVSNGSELAALVSGSRTLILVPPSRMEFRITDAKLTESNHADPHRP